MTTLTGFKGEDIPLKNCPCGSEPTYHSPRGLVHEIVCTGCGRQSDMETVGMDAVHAWNSGKIYRSAAECPIRGKYL